MTIAVTLTTTTTPPSVAIDIATLPVGTVALSVLRVVEAGILAALSVRGARGSVVGSTASLTDWDAPTGVPITYRITAFAADGTILETIDATTTAIADPGGSLCWLSDPLDASSARAVTMMVGTDSERSYVAPTSHTYDSDGYARAQVGTRRRPPVPLILRVEGLTEARAVRRLLTQTKSILFRPPSHLDMPPVIYGDSAELVEAARNQRTVDAVPVYHWAGTLTQTRGPGRDIVRGAWTYGDILALGLTYRDLCTAYGLPSGSFGSYRNLTRAP